MQIKLASSKSTNHKPYAQEVYTINFHNMQYLPVANFKIAHFTYVYSCHSREASKVAKIIDPENQKV